MPLAGSYNFTNIANEQQRFTLIIVDTDGHEKKGRVTRDSDIGCLTHRLKLDAAVGLSLTAAGPMLPPTSKLSEWPCCLLPPQTQSLPHNTSNRT